MSGEESFSGMDPRTEHVRNSTLLKLAHTKSKFFLYLKVNQLFCREAQEVFHISRLLLGSLESTRHKNSIISALTFLRFIEVLKKVHLRAYLWLHWHRCYPDSSFPLNRSGHLTHFYSIGFFCKSQGQLRTPLWQAWHEKRQQLKDIKRQCSLAQISANPRGPKACQSSS